MEVQNESPQNVPHWYADDFELRAVLASDSRETSALLPAINYLEELKLGASPIIGDHQPSSFFDPPIGQSNLFTF